MISTLGFVGFLGGINPIGPEKVPHRRLDGRGAHDYDRYPMSSGSDSGTLVLLGVMVVVAIRKGNSQHVWTISTAL